MSLIIEIESQELTVKTKKDKSGRYSLQTGYVHLVDRDGSPQRYPREFDFYAPTDGQGNQYGYKPGEYTVATQAFRLSERGQLEIGFLSLELVKAAK